MSGRKAVRAAPKLNILLGPDETSIHDSATDDHYSYRTAGGGAGSGAGGGGSRLYSESSLTEPVVHHACTTTPRCRLTQRAVGDDLYTGRPSCVEVRSCGCSLVSCPPPPPPPPPPLSSSATLSRRGQDSGPYAATRLSPVVGPKPPPVYWHDKLRRTADPDGHVTSGGSVGAELDAASKSPDLVLNSRSHHHRDPTLTGSDSTACTSGQDDQQRNSSTAGRRRFNNQQPLDGN